MVVAVAVLPGAVVPVGEVFVAQKLFTCASMRETTAALAGNAVA